MSVQSIAFFCAFLFSFTAYSQEDEVFQCDHGPEMEQSEVPDQEYNFLGKRELYDWLFKELMPTNLIKQNLERAENSFFRHLLDSFDQYPHPAELIHSYLPQRALLYSQRGTMKYVRFFPKRYEYDVKFFENKFTFEVRVHFKNATAEEKVHFSNQLRAAANIWNRHAIPMDFNYDFRFLVAESKKDAHFSVTLKDKTRGPYDANWARGWSATVVAHEVGHMMGLADEYQTLTAKIDCLSTSLMCYMGSPMRHHYYLVLRRLFNLN